MWSWSMMIDNPLTSSSFGYIDVYTKGILVLQLTDKSVVTAGGQWNYSILVVNVVLVAVWFFI